MACVNIRHATALALVGWYLMVPPLKNGAIIPDNVAPISEWLTVGHADTSLSCEQLRIFFRNEAEKKWRAELAKDGTTAIPEKDKAIKEKVDQRFLKILRKTAPVTYAKCVSTDDPRLKEK